MDAPGVGLSPPRKRRRSEEERGKCFGVSVFGILECCHTSSPYTRSAPRPNSLPAFRMAASETSLSSWERLVPVLLRSGSASAEEVLAELTIRVNLVAGAGQSRARALALAVCAQAKLTRSPRPGAAPAGHQRVRPVLPALAGAERGGLCQLEGASLVCFAERGQALGVQHCASPIARAYLTHAGAPSRRSSASWWTLAPFPLKSWSCSHSLPRLRPTRRLGAQPTPAPLASALSPALQLPGGAAHLARGLRVSPLARGDERVQAAHPPLAAPAAGQRLRREAGALTDTRSQGHFISRSLSLLCSTWRPACAT